MQGWRWVDCKMGVYPLVFSPPMRGGSFPRRATSSSSPGGFLGPARRPFSTTNAAESVMGDHGFHRVRQARIHMDAQCECMRGGSPKHLTGPEGSGSPGRVVS